MSSQGHGLQASNVIHFFKVILQSSLQDGELRIPKSFVTKCGKELSNPVLLRLPNGAEWEVNWVKRDGDVWFQNGWKNFAEYYSLAHGHFLVFRYEGRSQFHVLIFDMSASEIDYSGIRGTNEDEEVKLDQESDESNDSVEILYESERPRSPFHNPLPHKKTKTMPNGAPKGYSNPYVETRGTRFQRAKHYENRKINEGSVITEPKTRGCSGGCLFKTRKCSKSEDIKGNLPLEDIESSRTLERARLFQSENPFIIRRMHPSYVHRNLMVIPSHFSRKYLQGKQGIATIRVSGGRTWPVKYKFNNSSNRTILSTGWGSFVEENHLQEGDVCVFEMVGCTQVSFKIVIFRASEEPSSCTLQETKSNEGRSGAS